MSPTRTRRRISTLCESAIRTTSGSRTSTRRDASGAEAGGSRSTTFFRPSPRLERDDLVMRGATVGLADELDLRVRTALLGPGAREHEATVLEGTSAPEERLHPAPRYVCDEAVVHLGTGLRVDGSQLERQRGARDQSELRTG